MILHGRIKKRIVAALTAIMALACANATVFAADSVRVIKDVKAQETLMIQGYNSEDDDTVVYGSYLGAYTENGKKSYFRATFAEKRDKDESDDSIIAAMNSKYRKQFPSEVGFSTYKVTESVVENGRKIMLIEAVTTKKIFTVDYNYYAHAMVTKNTSGAYELSYRRTMSDAKLLDAKTTVDEFLNKAKKPAPDKTLFSSWKKEVAESSIWTSVEQTADFSGGYVVFVVRDSSKKDYADAEIIENKAANGQMVDIPKNTDKYINITLDESYNSGVEKGATKVKAENGQYHVVVLKGTKRPQTALKITKQPANATVTKSGANATLSVTAQGDGLTYAWYTKKANAKNFSAVKGANASTLKVAVTKNNSKSQFYCQVKDKYGKSVNSKAVTVELRTPLKLTKQPTDVYADKSGAKVTVKVTAQGDDLKYTWYEKDAKASKFTKSKVSKTASYSVAVSKKNSGRQVYCVVSDSHGKSVTSKKATITLRTPLKITTNLKNIKVKKAGNKATLTLKAQGDGLKYTWYVKGPKAKKFTKTTASKTNTLKMTVAKNASGTKVYCVVTDKYGRKVTSKTVTVSIKK